MLSVPALAGSELSCEDYTVSAKAVRTRADVPRFVQCAYEFAHEVGFEEAKRAFHEDSRWFDGRIYIFVDQLATTGDESLSLVYPPDPANVGQLWGAFPSFGSDLTAEQHRIATTFGQGWLYYEAGTHVPHLRDRKATYVMRINWDGIDAAIGSGIYPADLPGSCRPDRVNAWTLDAMPSDERLEEFVTCAARRVEADGYFAKVELESDQRWSNGSIYIFGIDLMGNQVLSGRKIRVNGTALHEWGGKDTQQFLGRDVVSIGDAFGDTYLYYHAINPSTGNVQRKISFVKRVLAQGVPVLVGAGYYVDE